MTVNIYVGVTMTEVENKSVSICDACENPVYCDCPCTLCIRERFRLCVCVECKGVCVPVEEGFCVDCYKYECCPICCRLDKDCLCAEFCASCKRHHDECRCDEDEDEDEGEGG